MTALQTKGTQITGIPVAFVPGAHCRPIGIVDPASVANLEWEGKVIN